MKIIVVGHTGMLGREVVKAVERMGHENEGEGWKVDITKMREFERKPEVVINCAGLVPQRKPPPSPSEFMLVNGYGPWRLADFCDQIGARLIHVSTDCVFDGTDYKPDESPQVESNPAQPVTPYGYSKFAGEIRRDPHLTVRTSFVGFGERGLIAELLKCAEDDKIYRASDQLFWTGHIVRFVAEALVMLAEREISGLLHIPGKVLSRYQLVKLLDKFLDETLGQGISIYRTAEPAIDRRLGSERWDREGLPDLPSFEWQLRWLRRSQ